ncbi:hypothetical protein [Buttiauxella sp. A111]|uniref:hypothetical protein n=1 Tax=Buttiauxella sp. A111 TaxID=2563088 RepID=UPI0010EBBE90|nr:hypothetical protein [Buttiauxella sp. A111]GDX04380.1 hypothetical protein BSPA111_05410 [Buttiauxella sp. A111]
MKKLWNVLSFIPITCPVFTGETLTGWIDPTDVSIDNSSTWNMTADSLVDDVSLVLSTLWHLPRSQ